MDTVVYTTMTLTSFSSGALIVTQGWTWLNLGSIVPVLVIAAALAWLAWSKTSRLQLGALAALPAATQARGE